jgi:poly(3-hydroxybutyrate) depolymerase
MLVACIDVTDDAPVVGAMTRHTIQHDGLAREYFMYLPSMYKSGAELPVVFFLHGYGGSATGTEAETTNGLNHYAEEYDYIMVYPQGTWFWSDESSDDRWEVTSFNLISSNFDDGPEGPLCTPDAVKYPCPPECGACGRCAWTSCHDDLGFLKQLFEIVATDFAADRSRYYLSGFSSGSMMAHYVGCEASEVFAAVVLVGGRIPRGYQCAPTKSVPLLQITGAHDETVPNDGRAASNGFLYASTDATASRWSEGTGCTDEARPWSNAITKEKGLQCSATCAGSDKESIDCLWPDGDHHWPGYPADHGTNGYCVTDVQQASMPEQTRCVEPDTDVDVWGSRLVFEFFDSHL